MALEFPRSFPSWVYGPHGASRLITSPNEFSALDPSQWADSPADWLDVQVPEAFKNNEQTDPVVADAFVAEEQVDLVEVTPEPITDVELVAILDSEPEPTPEPEPVAAPIKRGPGRPRKVQA